LTLIVIVAGPVTSMGAGSDLVDSGAGVGLTAETPAARVGADAVFSGEGEGLDTAPDCGVGGGA
jgi:hypothetical protein